MRCTIYKIHMWHIHYQLSHIHNAPKKLTCCGIQRQISCCRICSVRGRIQEHGSVWSQMLYCHHRIYLLLAQTPFKTNTYTHSPFHQQHSAEIFGHCETTTMPGQALVYYIMRGNSTMDLGRVHRSVRCLLFVDRRRQNSNIQTLVPWNTSPKMLLDISIKDAFHLAAQLLHEHPVQNMPCSDTKIDSTIVPELVLWMLTLWKCTMETDER